LAKKTHPFNVLLSPKEHNQLLELAQLKDVSAGSIIRQNIRWRHMMVTQNEPVCANGQRCFVPQMHTQPAPVAPAQTNAETTGG